MLNKHILATAKILSFSCIKNTWLISLLYNEPFALILFLITSFMFKSIPKLFLKDNLDLFLKEHISSH